MQQRAMLLQKSEALGRMTSGIAHDFNNLLAAVVSGLGLVDKNASDPEKVRSYTAATRTDDRAGVQACFATPEFRPRSGA
jgi:signal transduction histidine kinase